MSNSYLDQILSEKLELTSEEEESFSELDPKTRANRIAQRKIRITTAQMKEYIPILESLIAKFSASFLVFNQMKIFDGNEQYKDILTEKFTAVDSKVLSGLNEITSLMLNEMLLEAVKIREGVEID